MMKWGKSLAALALLGLVACNGRHSGSAPGQQTASLAIHGEIRSSQAAVVAALTTVAITVDGAALPGSPFPITNGRFTATAIVAPGAHTIVATAGVYRGSADVNAVFGANSVTLVLFDGSEPQNQQPAPIVESLVATPNTLTVLPDAVPTAALVADAVSFDAAATLSYAWTDSCEGSFSNASAAPLYTPPAFQNVTTRTCTISVVVTATGPNGSVSDPLFSKASTDVKVSYVAPVVVNGWVVTAPEFTAGKLVDGSAAACDLAWLPDATQKLALSADACAAKLHGATGGNPITFQASFVVPPAGANVTVSATGKAVCDGAAFTAPATVSGTTASFTWPAPVPAQDTACQLSVTVTFAGDASSSTPSSVSATLPVAFLLRAPVPVFDIIPAVLVGNYPSQPFQAQQAAELGDIVKLAGDRRHAAKATVVMSGWAKHSEWPGMDAAGFVHPVTLTIYDPTTLVKVGQVTQSFVMKWRPEADSTCPGGGTAWRQPETGLCFNGYAFPITFDLSAAGITLPESFLYGIAYNTQTWGYTPIGSGGPYDSLNVALVPSAPSVGTDVNPDIVWWNTKTADWYTDKGAGGVGIFRPDTNWTGYYPAVTFFAD